MSTRPPAPVFGVAEAVMGDGSPWSPTERLVALAIAHHMGKAAVAFPSEKRIADRTGLDRRTVQRAIARLCATGGLFEKRAGGACKGERYRATSYAFKGRRGTAPREESRGGGEPPLEDMPRGGAGAVEGRSCAVQGAVLCRTTEQINELPNQQTNGFFPQRSAWSREAASDWEARYGEGSASAGRIGAALKPLVTANGWDHVRPRWKHYLVARDPRFVKPEEFAQKYLAWQTPKTADKRAMTPGQMAATAGQAVVDKIRRDRE